MTTDNEHQANSTMGEPSNPVGTRMKIVWDDVNMKSAYANVAHVTGGREEIILLFGMNQAWHAGHKEVKVALSDRIVMNPFAAKRFSKLLAEAVENHEKRYGKMDLEMQRPEGVTLQ